MKIPIVLICLLAAQLISAGPLGNRPGRYSFNFQSTYFSTTANYDSNGEITDLAPGNSYDYFLLQPELRYDYSNRWSFFSNLYIPYVKSDDGSFNRESFNVTDISAGADFMLYNKSFRVLPSFELKVPLSSIAPNTDESFASEGVVEAISKIYLARDFGIFYGFTSLGFDYRMDGRSSLLTYAATIIHQRNRWAFSIGISGFNSVTDDEHKSNPSERSNITDNVNGGSLKFYSVNPSYLEFKSWLAYYLERQIFIKFKANAGINGKNYAHANYFGFDISYSFGGEKLRKLPKLRKEKEFKYNEKNFNIQYEYDEDEDVFDDNYYIKRRQEVQNKPSLNRSSRNYESGLKIEMKPKPKHKKRHKKRRKRK